MQVILIKDYKEHKANEIITVNDGFGKNYLIRNGIAQPVNDATMANRDKILDAQAQNEAAKIAEAEELKKEIEKVQLTFELKSNNNVVHGSITSKAIAKELITKHDIKLPAHSIDGVVLNTIGIHGVAVVLHPKVKAFLKVRINEAK